MEPQGPRAPKTCLVDTYIHGGGTVLKHIIDERQMNPSSVWIICIADNEENNDSDWWIRSPIQNILLRTTLKPILELSIPNSVPADISKSITNIGEVVF